MVWLPRELARIYGPLLAELRDALGLHLPRGEVPLLLHPQTPAAHRRLATAHGHDVLPGVWATPTSSYRSVLAWRGGREPVVLKLSIGAVIGRIRRVLREDQIARSVVMTAVFETIPPSHRAELGLDWFADVGGLVETHGGHGWLLRKLPRTVTDSDDRWLLPMFSAISPQGDGPPPLVDLIRRSGRPATEYVLETLIRPYVAALSYLLFVQGIQVEGHSQNLLLEMDERDDPTGRLVLRDFSDATVSIPLRVARRKPLPLLGSSLPAHGVPFPLAPVAADYKSNFSRKTLYRGADTVERYGLSGMVWPLNTSLTRYLKGYDGRRVERTYLELWQEASVRFLGVEPLHREDSQGIATDEALAYYLRHQDWESHGATNGHSLPEGVEPFLIERRARRRSGPVYQRLECEWGDMFLVDGLPAFFRPGF